jgi:hypothetical protein
MSGAASAGFFTLGVTPDRYRLPHRPIGIPIILLIRRVIGHALSILRAKNFNVCNAGEDELTAALRAVVENDLRQTGCVPGFNRRAYESVSRQAQVANHDGTRLAKAPDLCFRLRIDDNEAYTGLSEYDALFIECKPVDEAHPAGSKYCDDGLVRFVVGDYAWAMQDAMMLAYARHGRTLANHLIPAMRGPERMTSLATEQLPQPLAADSGQSNRGEPIHVSVHRREFDWLDGKGRATNINIYHLWVDCN